MSDLQLPDQIVYKPAGVPETFGIDWTDQIVSVWRRKHRYATGAIVRAPVGTGMYYVAAPLNSQAWGLSSELTQEFPQTENETFTDGSILWTARHPASLSLPSISQSVWTLDDGIVEDSNGIDGLIGRITVSGGSPGEQYRMVNLITKSDAEQEEDSLVLEIIDPADV